MMRIKTIAWVMFGTAIVLFSLTGISVVMLNTSEKEEIQALHRQAEFRKLGIELADASDYLTNEVQAYTQFGDQVHYDNYWREVRGTHTRDHVVQRLYELNAPAEELNLIELAKGNSDALIAIDEQAMAAVKGRDAGTTAADFAAGKIHASRFFCRYELPRVDRQAALLNTLDDTTLTMPDAGF